MFELARDEKSIDAVKADLDKFEAMLNDSADLKRLVRSPVFSADAQAKALSAVLDKAGIAGTSAKFLKVLTANRRLFAVADVIRAFRALVAKFRGEATADVTVAEQLSEKNLDALKTALKSVTANSRRLAVRTLRNLAEVPEIPALSSTALSAFDCASAENTGLRTRRLRSALSFSMASNLSRSALTASTDFSSRANSNKAVA